MIYNEDEILQDILDSNSDQASEEYKLENILKEADQYEE